ncbi:phasin, PhaP [Oceanicola granulosus HTCC2516]|uniref:Phasin, PhaP n=1 Tax=Oceanicola granulosus (strain ATCC BAA-861 / DSM 15982 / KCTC 12143 / HTCC2516) TaxID=314256 RepID=Q2CFV4_OCEGH|nr:phasin family protein [Oceanicola granulosus]EAR51588.1 phasin, PhaP [Oceanicola granulosus HTCC2516]
MATTTNTPDLATMMKDMMGAFPMDTKGMEDAFKTQTTLAEKLSAVSIDAAQKSTELSAKWANDTLVRLSAMTQAKSEPADYAKAMTDFASASAEVAAEHMAAFADIAKKVQTESIELMLAAGKDMTEEMTVAAKKASDDVTAATKKASASAK